MERVARLMATGLVVAVAALVGIGAMGSEAHAAELDWRERMEKQIQMYGTHSNEWYMNRIEAVREKGNTNRVDQLIGAAQRGCKGTLYEDFSCKERKGIRAADALPFPTDAACEAWMRHHWDGRNTHGTVRL